MVQGSQRKAKRYLKTNYRIYCQPEEAECPDYCLKFVLSDKENPDFPESCMHMHLETCKHCENLKSVLDDMEGHIRGSSWNPYSKEQQDDLLYDFKHARSDIN